MKNNYLDNYLLENNIDKIKVENTLAKMNISKELCSDLLSNLNDKKYNRNAVNLNHFIYWLKVSEFIDENVDCFESKSPFPHQIYRISLGRKNYIELQRNLRVNIVAVYVNIKDKNKEIFEYLYDFKDEIKDIVGLELLWDKRDGEILSKISQAYVIDISDVDNWLLAIDWQVKLAEKLYIAFYPLLEEYYNSN